MQQAPFFVIYWPCILYYSIPRTIVCACSLTSVMSDSVKPCGPQPGRLPVHGILQARILEWVAISNPGIKPHIYFIFCIAGGFFTAESPGQPSSREERKRRTLGEGGNGKQRRLEKLGKDSSHQNGVPGSGQNPIMRTKAWHKDDTF